MTKTAHLIPRDPTLYDQAHRRACQLVHAGEPHPKFDRKATTHDVQALAVRIYGEAGGTWTGREK